MSRLRSLLPALALLLAAAPVAAQGGPPLEHFVQQVGRHWNGGDADALADLMPDGGQVMLDTGRGTEAVNPRHAAAALRALFSERQTVSVRPVRATVAGGSPQRGFGELSWAFRTRGASAAQTRSVYVGAVLGPRGWRISELRLMP